jgi:hypothetical protein
VFAVRRGDGVVGGYLALSWGVGCVTRVSNFGFRALGESIGGVRGRCSARLFRVFSGTTF